MTYRYRLSIACSRYHIFRFGEARRDFMLGDSHSVKLVARDADTLEEASKVHFEGVGFPDEVTARAAGERLRLRLRILNAALGLGLNVPLNDEVTGGVSSAVRERVSTEHGAELVDTVFGLAVFPDDEHYVEVVMSGRATVRKPDGTYLLEGLSELWGLEVSLDQAAEDALAIVGIATRETSDRAKFLTTYLALEALIPRSERSPEAREVIGQAMTVVKKSDLQVGEMNSLVGALGALQMESFGSALMSLVDRIEDPPSIRGRPLRQFLSECISVRNAIVHRSPIDLELPLNELANSLREFILTVIWSQNRIPNFRLDVPGDRLSFAPGGMQFRIL